MRSDPTPNDGDAKSVPFFIPKALPFTYRVFYTYKARTEQIEYRSPHEVILNLRLFQNSDTIVYVNADTDVDVFSMTVDRFKMTVAEKILELSDDEIEALYIRLLLVNHHSNSISDKGHLKEIDRRLRKQLAKIKNGYDHYFTGDILYLKYRRRSINHLRAVILERTDIRLYHINLPQSIPNSWLFRNALNLSIPDTITRIYTFTPVPEDNIVDTPIPGMPGKIIRIINTLIK
jgi:hypothetical protein